MIGSADHHQTLEHVSTLVWAQIGAKIFRFHLSYHFRHQLKVCGSNTRVRTLCFDRKYLKIACLLEVALVTVRFPSQFSIDKKSLPLPAWVRF